MADTLPAGESLGTGDTLPSSNEIYHVIMQDDGNFVMYDNDSGAPVWATGTVGSGASSADMQEDGNFVLYRSDDVPVWSSHTDGQGPDCRLVMQDDRNLVIYNGGGSAIWASNTGF